MEKNVSTAVEQEVTEQTAPAAEQTNDKLVKLAKPYKFDDEEYSEIDLSGLDKLTIEDAVLTVKKLTGDGELAAMVMPETSTAYTDELAAKATDLPIEFFKLLPIGASKKVRQMVQGAITVPAQKDESDTRPHILHLHKPYLYKGETHTEVDLSGVGSLTKSSGGLFGMLKGSSLSQYGTSVANSVKGLHGTNLVQQTIGVGKWLGQTAKNGVGGIASSLAGIFGSPMQNAMNSPLGNFITSIGQKAVGLGKGAVGGVKNFAGNTLYGAKTLAGNIASSKVGQTAVKIGGGAVQGVKDVTQFLGAGLNVGQTVLGPVAGKLGGAFMGLLGTFGPVIAGIGSIIAVVSLLGDHFADIQQIVLKVFGPTGLKIFNTFFADVKKIGDGIKNAFSLDNLLNIQEKLSGKSMFGVDLGQAFGAAIPIIQSVTGLVSQIVDLGVNHIKPLLADVMSFVVNELFPAVAPLISTIIDLVGTTLVNAIKVIVDVIHGLLPVIEPVIQGIIGLIRFHRRLGNETQDHQDSH